MHVAAANVSMDWSHIAAGAIGALIVWFLGWLRRLGAKLLANRRPLAQYRCDDDSGLPGSLKHSWGRSVDDSGAENGRAWEHTATHVGDPGGNATVYGPYTNDFNKPGQYRVVFRVYGSGFDGSDDSVVLLQVTQTLIAFDSTRQTTENWFQMPTGQRIIRARELRPNYQDFSVHCYASGPNIYEYRVFIYPKYHDSRAHTIRFDSIRVYRFVPGMELM